MTATMSPSEYPASVGQMTFSNINDAVPATLRSRAAAAGRSLEEQARLAAVRATLAGHRDRDAANLVREMRDERTRKLSG